MIILYNEYGEYDQQYDEQQYEQYHYGEQHATVSKWYRCKGKQINLYFF